MARLTDFRIRLAHSISNRLYSLAGAADGYRQAVDKQSPVEFNAIVIPSANAEMTKDIFDEHYLLSARNRIVSATTADTEDILGIQRTLDTVPYVVGNLQAPEEFFALGKNEHDPARKTNRHIAPNGYSLREVVRAADEFAVAAAYDGCQSRFFQETALHDLQGNEIVNPAAVYLRDEGVFVRHNPDSGSGFLASFVLDAVVSFSGAANDLFAHNTRADLQLNKPVHDSLEDALQEVARKARFPLYEGHAHQQ